MVFVGIGVEVAVAVLDVGRTELPLQPKTRQQIAIIGNFVFIRFSFWASIRSDVEVRVNVKFSGA
jgi:hypothetical protein